MNPVPKVYKPSTVRLTPDNFRFLAGKLKGKGLVDRVERERAEAEEEGSVLEGRPGVKSFDFWTMCSETPRVNLHFSGSLYSTITYSPTPSYTETHATLRVTAKAWNTSSFFADVFTGKSVTYLSFGGNVVSFDLSVLSPDRRILPVEVQRQRAAKIEAFLRMIGSEMLATYDDAVAQIRFVDKTLGALPRSNQFNDDLTRALTDFKRQMECTAQRFLKSARELPIVKEVSDFLADAAPKK